MPQFSAASCTPGTGVSRAPEVSSSGQLAIHSLINAEPKIHWYPLWYANHVDCAITLKLFVFLYCRFGLQNTVWCILCLKTPQSRFINDFSLTCKVKQTVTSNAAKLFTNKSWGLKYVPKLFGTSLGKFIQVD